MAFRPKMTPPGKRKISRSFYRDDLRPRVVAHLCDYVFVLMSNNSVYALPIPTPTIPLKLCFALHNESR